MVSYNGDFKSFREAAKLCGGGYSTETIFNKVKNAALAVANGEAAYERDSFLFYEKAINYNLMMYLQMIIMKEGFLKICDWGGALGSTFFQHRELIETWECSWTIVEQPHFVQFGKRELAGGRLNFAESLDEIKECNCILFSSVLQYLEHYEEVISAACKKQPSYVIIERTPVSDKSKIWIETVHEPIYEAMYPCYVFKESELTGQFEEQGYRLIDSWHSLVDGVVPISGEEKAVFKSYVFEKG